MAGSPTRGGTRQAKFLGPGGIPIRNETTDHYADGAVGTPNPPKPRSGNPFINPETNERYPGAPS
jgi:hypothetical protein